jgi:hypothetical protein
MFWSDLDITPTISKAIGETNQLVNETDAVA